MFIYVYFDRTFSFRFYYRMLKEIPRYGEEVANERITICVPSRIKCKWELYTKKKKIKLPQMLRDQLDQMLQAIDKQLAAES